MPSFLATADALPPKMKLKTRTLATPRCSSVTSSSRIPKTLAAVAL
jgi:hypothetical protein